MYFWTVKMSVCLQEGHKEDDQEDHKKDHSGKTFRCHRNKDEYKVDIKCSLFFVLFTSSYFSLFSLLCIPLCIALFFPLALLPTSFPGCTTCAYPTS